MNIIDNKYDKTIKMQGVRFLANRNNRSLGETGNMYDINGSTEYLHSDEKTGPLIAGANVISGSTNMVSTNIIVDATNMANASITKGKKSIIEGFDNGPVNKINDIEMNEMNTMRTEFQRELANYNNLKTQLMDNTRSYLEASRGANSRNVSIDGKYGYVNQAGLFKEYTDETIANETSGKNDCPANWSSAPTSRNSFPNDFTNQLFDSIPGNPPLINGLPMRSGQACGNEGKNVFVSQVAPTQKSYLGIYQSVSGSDMQLQEDLDKTTIEQCHSRAALKNKNYFAMSDFDGTKATCYIGNNSAPVENSGTSVSITNVKDFGVSNPDSSQTPHLFMGYDGRLHAYSGNNNYWSSDNQPISGCDPIGGGNIFLGPGSGASATYGQNCSNWNVKANRAATGLGGSDPLPGNLPRVQKKGNKALQ